MRVVVLRALKLGDFLTALPAFRALRRAYPDARISLVAPAQFAALLDLAGDPVDEIVDSGELQPLAPQLHGADLAVNLHGRGPQSHRLLLATHPRRLLAFAHPAIPESAGGARYDDDEHEVDRWCRLLADAGIRADPSELDIAAPPVALPPDIRGATLLHPGASSEARRWPVDRWIEVARAEQRLGRSVVITGGADEVERARAVAAGAEVPPAHVYAGRTTLRELTALVAAAGRIVCGDTGIAHLATALHRPSVVLFGPIAPSRWGPPPRPYHRVLWSGRTGNGPAADDVDPGLLTITPERVIAELDALPAPSV